MTLEEAKKLIDDWSKKSATIQQKPYQALPTIPTGAKKNDVVDAKVRLDLFPPSAYYGISTVFTYGAVKYDDWNWAKGLPYSRLYGALLRHMMSWFSGQETDPETGFSHLWHAGCNIAMLIHTELVVKQARLDGFTESVKLDDRPRQFHPKTTTEPWSVILKHSDSYQELLKKK